MSGPVITLPPGFDTFDLEPILPPHSELVAHFFARTISPKQSEIDFLTSRGVPALALCNDPHEEGWAVGRAFVVIDEGGLFEFAAEGDAGAIKALCIVARDCSGWPVDIVAWAPKEDRVAAHLGHVTLLGEQRVDVFRFDDEPLAVHRSVLGWLCAGRAGVVVVDERRAGHVLRDSLGDLAVEDDAHAREIAALLSGTVDLSRIIVPRADRRAA